MSARSKLRVFGASAVLSVASVTPALAQVAVNSVTLGWAVQDTSNSPLGDLIRTVLAYYRLPKPGRSSTPLWASEEQSRYPLYDLAAPTLYQEGFQATILGVLPDSPDSSRWVVRILFASADSTGHDIQALGLQRLYARRASSGSLAPHGWELSGALREVTRNWQTRRVGAITYYFGPGYRFRRDRAEAAQRFIDSAAARIDVSPPKAVDYYLTSTWEGCERLRGLDWVLSRVVFAGSASPENRLLCSGNPAFGEAYRHELAHMILAPLGSAEQQNRLISEGAATWLGGGNQGSLEAYYQLLQEYLREQPDASFASLLQSFDAEPAFYATGALVTDAVVRRGGLLALHRLLAAGPGNDDVLAVIPGLLGIPTTELDAWWRREAQSMASAAVEDSGRQTR